MRKMVSNAALRRFYLRANKLYFEGNLDVADIRFSNDLRKNRIGESQLRTYEEWWGPKSTHRPVERDRFHIRISSKLKPYRDLCLMTVYHEMVHVELDGLGIRGKNNLCSRNGEAFNRRMTELAQAGAFNGLW